MRIPYLPNRPRSFIKCAGGKTKLLPELMKRVPEKFGMYHEPFVGGGALFFALASAERIRLACLNDANQHLVDAYCVVRDELPEVLRRLALAENTQKFFDWVRAIDPDTLNGMQRAVRFLYLNRTCFNGLHRVNKKGKFNVPFGRYKTLRFDEENFRACSNALRLAFISRGDFESTNHPKPRPGDLVYLDPPYLPASKTSDFTSYTADGFGWKDHLRLAAYAADLKQRGVHVIVSQGASDEIRILYREFGFKVDVVHAPRSVNSKGTGRGPVEEFVIS